MIRAAKRRAARRRARRACLGAAVAIGTSTIAPAAAPAIEVNSLGDPGTGTCGDGTCTLREAISAAQTNPGPDTITFKSGLSGTLRLDGPSGQLSIYSPVSIEGPGAPQLAISGDSNSDGTPDTGLIYARSEGVSISGLTLTAGNGKPNSGASVSDGGAIYSYQSALTLDHVVVSNSSAHYDGGAIFSKASDLSIVDSTIVGNQAPPTTGGEGGAISAQKAGSRPGSLTVRGSTIANNYSGDNGGGIYAFRIGDLTIERSTISGNSAPGYFGSGGGVLFYALSGAATIEDSTIAGNACAYYGGGVSAGVAAGGASIRNSTVAGNTVTDPMYGKGGGIAQRGALVVSSSIVADNAPQDLFAFSGAPTATLTSSLLENSGGAPIQQSPPGSSILGVDPQLQPLANNGGPTQTQLIATTSPAIDKGLDNGLTTDQRGLPRSSRGATDIGAVELQDVSVDSPNVSAAAKQKIKGKAVQVVVDAGAGEAVQVIATGSITPPKKKHKGGKHRIALRGRKPIALAPASGSAAAGSRTKLTLVPASVGAGRKLAKALAKGGKAKASIDVKLTDSAGNSDTETVTVTLKGVKKKAGG